MHCKGLDDNGDFLSVTKKVLPVDWDINNLSHLLSHVLRQNGRVDCIDCHTGLK